MYNVYYSILKQNCFHGLILSLVIEVDEKMVC